MSIYNKGMHDGRRAYMYGPAAMDRNTGAEMFDIEVDGTFAGYVVITHDDVHYTYGEQGQTAELDIDQACTAPDFYRGVLDQVAEFIMDMGV